MVVVVEVEGLIGVITHTSRQHMLLISVQTPYLPPLVNSCFQAFPYRKKVWGRSFTCRVEHLPPASGPTRILSLLYLSSLMHPV